MACLSATQRKTAEAEFNGCVFDAVDTREKRSAHACLPCFRREFACASPDRNYTRYQNKIDSDREIPKSKLHTQKISLEFHEHKVY